MTDVIRRNYGHIGFKPKPWIIPTWILGVASVFSAQVGCMISKIGTPNRYVPNRPDAYCYQHSDIVEIVNASVDSMLEHGWLNTKST